jgi:diguanylate cyclase
MSTPQNPSELARETLRQLAMRRVPPTPDNYRTLYHEIAGTKIAETFPERAWKGLIAGLPRDNPEQVKLARQLDAVVGSQNWDSIRATLTEFIAKATGEPLNWNALLRDLLTQLEKHHAGMTPGKKRETLEHLFSTSSAPDLLFGRLQNIVKSWGAQPDGNSERLAEQPAPLPTPPGAAVAAGAAAAVTAPTTAPAATTAASSSTASSTVAASNSAALIRSFSDLQTLVAKLLEDIIGPLVYDNEELAKETAELAAAISSASLPEHLPPLIERLKKYSYRLHFIAEDQVELKAALLHLIQLIVENINELVVEDQWLTGQLDVVRQLISEPLNLRRIDDVERRMKDVIFKQSALKQSLNEAKDRLKLMLATFVDRLADFSETTSDYHDKIEHCADRISKANDIRDLSDVLDEVMRETRVVQLNAQRSRDELKEMRGRVSDAEVEINRLQGELSQASEMVRYDPLTGVLNRKGMNEAIEAEVGRARRQNTKLCMALLDIDNFKKLNDSLGHAAGDSALQHLAKVVKETIRPQDSLSRYGGEEFVVLLPDTPLDSAMTAMVRVQRELTRRFFLHNNDKVLITFSCGVAELGDNEDPHDTLKRADAGMYIAKRNGKNRVVPN